MHSDDTNIPVSTAPFLYFAVGSVELLKQQTGNKDESGRDWDFFEEFMSGRLSLSGWYNMQVCAPSGIDSFLSTSCSLSPGGILRTKDK